MAKNALIEHRPWLLASITAAVAYYFVSDNPIGEVWLMLIKGAGVGLLAAYALRRTSGADGMLLAAALALSAVADMALVLFFEIGGAVFFASHLVAIALYLRNRRDSTSVSQKLLGAALLVGTPIISFLLSQDPMVALYAISLGTMAATSWTSSFPRYRVGIGAVLFVVSDFLIFAKIGPLNIAPLPDLLVWPLYYAGQVMIATGVVQTLRGETPAR